jgi:hypothetical protein
MRPRNTWIHRWSLRSPCTRSGGPALKSSAAYTKTFAEWVLEKHMVPTVGHGCGVSLGVLALPKNLYDLISFENMDYAALQFSYQ